MGFHGGNVNYFFELRSWRFRRNILREDVGLSVPVKPAAIIAAILLLAGVTAPGGTITGDASCKATLAADKPWGQ